MCCCGSTIERDFAVLRLSQQHPDWNIKRLADELGMSTGAVCEARQYAKAFEAIFGSPEDDAERDWLADLLGGLPDPVHKRELFPIHSGEFLDERAAERRIDTWCGGLDIRKLIPEDVFIAHGARNPDETVKLLKLKQDNRWSRDVLRRAVDVLNDPNVPEAFKTDLLAGKAPGFGHVDVPKRREPAAALLEGLRLLVGAFDQWRHERFEVEERFAFYAARGSFQVPEIVGLIEKTIPLLRAVLQVTATNVVQDDNRTLAERLSARRDEEWEKAEEIPYEF